MPLDTVRARRNFSSARGTFMLIHVDAVKVAYKVGRALKRLAAETGEGFLPSDLAVVRRRRGLRCEPI